MISKVQAYNVNQPNFTSKVRVSDRFAQYYGDLNNIFKKQIKAIENNGNNDFVMIDKPRHGGDAIYMRVYKKVNNKLMDNFADGFTELALAEQKGYTLVDIYNDLINEKHTKFSESRVSKNLFKYL